MKGMELILFIITLILTVIGIAVVAKGELTDGRDVMRIRWAGWLVLGIAALTLIFNVFTIVPTRNIAVSMAFGKPTGTLGNGFHLIAPWESTEEYDAAIQTLKFDGDAKDDDSDPAPTVRLANGATARVDVTVQWQIDPSADIQQLHLDYRNFGNIQDNVVKRQLAGALNATFEKYDPLIALKGGVQDTTLAGLAKTVAKELTDLLPVALKVRSVTIPLIRFDAKVQEALDKYQQALAETQIAEQRKKTAQAQKDANDILAAANNSPGVLFQNCLDMTERMAQQGKAISAAWSCGSPLQLSLPITK
jgi:regulator of protease activity HflC (stomatin/prohibitin superfamily)